MQFYATGCLPPALAGLRTAKVTSGGGSGASCGTAQGSTISCYIPTLAVNAVAAVEVDVTPSSPAVQTPIAIAGKASANGGPVGASILQPAANVVDFTITAAPCSQTIDAGDTDTFQVIFAPTISLGYSATITPSQSYSPSMVTSPSPSFNPSTVTLSGSACGATSLSIQTVARPVNTGSLLRRGSFLRHLAPHRRPEPGRTRHRRKPQASPLADCSCSLPDRRHNPAAARLRRGQHHLFHQHRHAGRPLHLHHHRLGGNGIVTLSRM